MAIYDDSGTGKPLGAPLSNSTVSFNPTTQAAGANVDAAFSSPLTLTPGNYFLALALTFTGTFTTNPILTSLTPIGNTWLGTNSTSLGNISTKGWMTSGASASTMPTISSPFQGSGAFPIIALKAQ
jgi:hypothetical protein